jgi:DNA-binding NarL/FixJ family response regulator
MLSSETAQHTQAAAREAGAAGYLAKGTAPDELLDAIRAVARGATFWPAGHSPAH